MRVPKLILAVLVASFCAPALMPPAAEAQPLRAEVELTAAPADYALLPGPLTHGLRYTAVVISGDPAVVAPGPGPYLGPTFRVNQGDRLRIRFRNRTGASSIVHWHGLSIPDDMDGHPRHAVADSADYVYEFTVLNRAGTYWYHPHPDMLTGPQVYRGLAGLFIVSDPEEQSLSLPRAEYDVPLVIQDRKLDASNQLVYSGTGSMGGWLGDRMLVNGVQNYSFSAATRVYRFRFLNGSNGRTYKLAWSDGTPMTVIGTDGGLIEAPLTRPYVMLSPGERIEVWADLRSRATGSFLVLRSQAFTPGGMGGGSPPDGALLDLMRVNIDRAETESLALPGSLTAYEHYDPAQAVNGANPRTFAISFVSGSWHLNDAMFDMEGVLPNEIVNLGDLEAWQFTNDTGMAAMQMLHPMHLHGFLFQVYERTVAASGAAAYATVNQGLVDSGWKDTFIIMPGERVKLLVRFDPFPGLFLYHCHILEHEDHGMMRNFRVDGTVSGVAPPARDAARITMAREDRDTGGFEIRYVLSSPGPSPALAIHDVRGRRLALLNGVPSTEGEHAVSWDRRGPAGQRVAPGVYVVSLRTAGDFVTRKFVLTGP